MIIKFTRKTLLTEFRDTKKWPQVDISSTVETERIHFERYHNAIVAYLNGDKLIDIKKSTGVCSDSLLKALNRCVSPAADGRIYGWRGIIFYFRVHPYVRKANSSKFDNGKGLSGEFKKLFAHYPKIQEELIRYIHKKNLVNRIQYQNLEIALKDYSNDSKHFV